MTLDLGNTFSRMLTRIFRPLNKDQVAHVTYENVLDYFGVISHVQNSFHVCLCMH